MDEANFSNSGRFNRKTITIDRENPILTRSCNPQRRFNISARCGLIGSRIIGSVFYQEALTGAWYIEMITAILWQFLDGLNLLDGQVIFFQQEGAPAYNIRQVGNLLEDNFGNRYLPTKVPLRWHPCSPELTTLVFSSGDI